jgi:hypothetical protein
MFPTISFTVVSLAQLLEARVHERQDSRFFRAIGGFVVIDKDTTEDARDARLSDKGDVLCVSNEQPNDVKYLTLAREHQAHIFTIQ